MKNIILGSDTYESCIIIDNFFTIMVKSDMNNGRVAHLVRDKIKSEYVKEFCQGNPLDEQDEAQKEFYEAFMSYLFCIGKNILKQSK